MTAAVTFADIAATAAAVSGLGPAAADAEVAGSRRNRRALRHVWLAYQERTAFLARRLRPDLSLPWIGRRMGSRHHTSIMHMIGREELRLRDDPAEAVVLSEILERLGLAGLPPAPATYLRLVETGRARGRAAAAKAYRAAEEARA